MNFLKKLTGSFAEPAAENPTVEMIEAAYAHHQLPWRYINFEVSPEQLADAVRGARAMGFAGFNCSLPHKVAVIQHLDGLGESAEVIGAVNCVVRRDDRLIGENTDGKGFLESLKEQIDPNGRRMTILGAGGAARAIAVESALAGVESISIVNRNLDRGRELAELLQTKTPCQASHVEWAQPFRPASDCDILVNATSVGLFPDINAELNLDIGGLRPEMLVADVIPNPLRTRLIVAAENAGCTTLDGLGMLVNQGVVSIRYWTGEQVEPDVMRQRVVDVLGMNAPS